MKIQSFFNAKNHQITEVKQVRYSEIQCFEEIAKKEDLTFCNKTIYFAAFHKCEIVGFTGIIVYSNKVVFKNHFVLPQFRHNGFFNAMFNFSVAYALSLDRHLVEATCTSQTIDYYLSKGAKVIKKFKTFTKVHLEIGDGSHLGGKKQ